MSSINPLGSSSMVSIGQERPKFINPQTQMKQPPRASGPEVAKADSGSIQMAGGSEGTNLPSPDISSQRVPTFVSYDKFGHSRTGTLAGNKASIPANVYGLGVNLPAPKGRIDVKA